MTEPIDLDALDEYADTGADYEFARVLHKLTDELRAARKVVEAARKFYELARAKLRDKAYADESSPNELVNSVEGLNIEDALTDYDEATK